MKQLNVHDAEDKIMNRWMFGDKLKDKLFCVEPRQMPGVEDIITVLQRNTPRLKY